MRRRLANASGYINLPKANFEAMVERAKTDQDLTILKDAYCNYLGHRNLVPQKTLDKMMLKALEIGKPATMFDVFKYHSELLYHPHPHVTKKYLQSCEAAGYDVVKQFFASIKGRYMLQRSSGLHEAIIAAAFANGDKDTVIDAYLDVLDYASEITKEETFFKVLECMDYKEVTDHVLFGHLKEQMDSRKLDSRIHSAIYYFHANGGLTAADLINSIAADSKAFPNSELFKTQLIAHVTDHSFKVDGFVRDRIVEALMSLAPKLDKNFYKVPEKIDAPIKTENV